jgi:hypothetical protein
LYSSISNYSLDSSSSSDDVPSLVLLSPSSAPASSVSSVEPMPSAIVEPVAPRCEITPEQYQASLKVLQAA